MAVTREMGGLSDQQYSYLLNNQDNHDEWPDMKSLIQTWFSKHEPKALDKAFKAKDCCVERVLSADEALESTIISSQVLKGKIAKNKMTPIIKLLQQEAKMRNDVLI